MRIEVIKNHRQYTISEDGVVFRIIGRRHKESKPLTQSFHVVKGKEYPNGYYYVTLATYDGTDTQGNTIDISHYKPISIHRLVALQFVENPMGYKEVNHIDGDKLNNHYSNLEWVTHSTNIKHSYERLGREIKRGSDHWRFGKKASSVTKYRQSIAKRGKNHPKYSGFYIVNGKKYYSANEAAISTGLNQRTLLRWCKAQKDGFAFVSDKNKIY